MFNKQIVLKKLVSFFCCLSMPFVIMMCESFSMKNSEILYSIFQTKPLSQGSKHSTMVSIAANSDSIKSMRGGALPPSNPASRFSQASSIENKQDWIKHIREVIQERTIHLKGALKEPIHIPKSATTKHKGRR